MHYTIPTPLRGAVARGFCWGDSISSSIKSAVAQGETDGIPTFSWIGPHAKRTQDYAIFLAEIPEGWRGTADRGSRRHGEAGPHVRRVGDLGPGLGPGHGLPDERGPAPRFPLAF